MGACSVAQSCLTLCYPMDFVDHHAPLSMGFFRQEYWSGLPCLPPGDRPNPETEPMFPASPTLAGRFSTTEPSAPWQSWPLPHHLPPGSWCYNDGFHEKFHENFQFLRTNFSLGHSAVEASEWVPAVVIGCSGPWSSWDEEIWAIWGMTCHLHWFICFSGANNSCWESLLRTWALLLWVTVV